MKKTIAILLTASIFLSGLTGCTITPANSNQTTTTTSESTNEPSNTTNPTDGTTKPTDSTTTQSGGTIQPTTNTTQTTNTTEEPNENASPVSDFEYKVNEDNGITITKYIGDDENVVIPSKIDGRNVTEIGQLAFAQTNIKQVVLSANIKTILIGAFGSCENLESIVLNEGLITIKDSAFGGKSKLCEIVIPKTVEVITEQAFSGCSSLEKIIFEGDAPDTYLYLEKELPQIAHSVSYTIYYHENAEGFTWPCWNGYQTAVIEQPTISVPTFQDFIYSENEDGGISIYKYIGNKETITIPEQINEKNVTKIAVSAFKENKNIRSVTIPDTVTVIEPRAFWYCSSLSTVNFSNQLKYIGECAFEMCDTLSSIVFPSTLTYLGNYAFSNCVGLRQINIPQEITFLGNSAFAYSVLEEIEWNEGIETIGANAFSNTNITELILPQSVKTISNGAFSMCQNLETVVLNEGLVSIGDWAFQGANKLTELIIPKTVENVTELAFTFCSNLEKLKFDGNAPSTFISEDGVGASNVSYVVCYHVGANGFTSPTWNGYQTEIW